MVTTIETRPATAVEIEVRETERVRRALADALRRHPSTPEGRTAAWAEIELIAENPSDRDLMSAEVLEAYPAV